MDSKTVNKLIRSEVWPLLRAQGFSTFDSRTAYRHRPSVIDVVNFQSFNSLLASSLGCTSYSFALNLGVYVLGCPGEPLIKKGRSGTLLPQEYQCSFRTHLRKRSPVDGFARADIFFVDSAGSSAAACFGEARYLLTSLAPSWFEECSKFDRVIAWMEGTASEPEGFPAGYGYGIQGARTSYARNELLATLRVAMHNARPTPESSKQALKEIERTVGSIFDLSPRLTRPLLDERYALNVRELVQRLGFSAPIDASDPDVSMPASLLGSAWSARGVIGLPREHH